MRDADWRGRTLMLRAWPVIVVSAVAVGVAGCGGGSGAKLDPTMRSAWQAATLDVAWCAVNGFAGTNSEGYHCHGGAAAETRYLMSNLDDWKLRGASRAALVAKARTQLRGVCRECVAVLDREGG